MNVHMEDYMKEINNLLNTHKGETRFLLNYLDKVIKIRFL